ncbi:MAG TPA: hypothetical protein VN643_17790 [Pyrinomonadaceae bacterium]|nr:hypothetical protein [Pyrinomonadaceae bacterium]
MKLSLRTEPIDEKAHTANYEISNREVSVSEALSFLNRLVSQDTMLYLETPQCTVDIWKFEGAFWVEIYRADFWATSEVSELEARAIIEIAERDSCFGNNIPTSNREWDAYALIGEATDSGGIT